MKMMFSRTNQRTQIRPNEINQIEPTVGFYRKSLMFPFPIQTSPISNNSENNSIRTSIPDTQIQKPKKMKWGEPTWFLLHTLAEKVKNDSFSHIRIELLNTIYTICTNLPCPDCSAHAKNYLDSINFNTILTKHDLKQMLFNFHNELNAKKKFTIFTQEELDMKYQTANTINIIYNFMDSFLDKHRSPQMIANDMFRRRIAGKLGEWFNTNIIYFDL